MRASPETFHSDGLAIAAYRNKHGRFKDAAGLKQALRVDAGKIDAVQDRIEF